MNSTEHPTNPQFNLEQPAGNDAVWLDWVIRHPESARRKWETFNAGRTTGRTPDAGFNPQEIYLTALIEVQQRVTPAGQPIAGPSEDLMRDWENWNSSTPDAQPPAQAPHIGVIGTTDVSIAGIDISEDT